MDYLPANIARKGEKQGDYFSPTIGAYDYWAIEYAYKPIEGKEKEELAKIAAKAADPELTFGTDEDVWLESRSADQPLRPGRPAGLCQEPDQAGPRQPRRPAEPRGRQGRGLAARPPGLLRADGRDGPGLVLWPGYVAGEYTCRDHRGDKRPAADEAHRSRQATRGDPPARRTKSSRPRRSSSSPSCSATWRPTTGATTASGSAERTSIRC